MRGLRKARASRVGCFDTLLDIQPQYHVPRRLVNHHREHSRRVDAKLQFSGHYLAHRRPIDTGENLFLLYCDCVELVLYVLYRPNSQRFPGAATTGKKPHWRGECYAVRRAWESRLVSLVAYTRGTSPRIQITMDAFDTRERWRCQWKSTRSQSGLPEA